MIAKKIIGIKVTKKSNIDLVLLMRTTTANESVTVPCFNSGVFNATINWGDNSGNLPVVSHNDANLTHEYLSSGDYEVTIAGSLPNLYFNNGANRLKIIKILSGGVFERLDYAFFRCVNLNYLASNTDISTVSNFDTAWHSCSSLTEFPLLNMSGGDNFNNAWFSCTGLSHFPLVDVSNGSNFNYSWRNCSLLTDFPLLDVAKGVNFNATWRNCNLITEFPSLNFVDAKLFRGDRKSVV